MKLKQLILFPAMFLAACSSRYSDPVETQFIASPNKQLQNIDSLMWRHPDSALMVLIDFVGGPQADSLNAFDGHYCQLLLSELLYKKSKPQANREELLKAVDYFDSIVMSDGRDAINRVSTDIVFLDARTHYIKGVGYFEMDSLEEACAEYLKALELMETHYDEGDFVDNKVRFMGFSYNRLYDLFVTQNMTELAIYSLEHAVKFILADPPNPIGLSVTYRCIGLEYTKLGEFEIANRYYEQAYEALPDTNNSYIFRAILAEKATNDYLKGMEIEKVMETFRHVCSLKQSKNEKLLHYLNMGGLYLHEKMYDSAIVYLQIVFDEKEDVGSKMAAAYSLRLAYDSLGDVTKSNEYMRFWVERREEEYPSTYTVSQLEVMFHNYLMQKQAWEAKKERDMVIRKIILTLIPVAVVIVLTIIIVAKLRSKKLLKQQHEQADKVLEVSELKHEEELMRLHSEADKALEKNKRKYEEELKQLRTENNEQLEAMERMHQQKIGKMHADLTSKKQQSHAMLIDRAMKVYNKSGNHGDGKVFKEIMTEFEMQYPNAEKKLKEALPDFSDSEIDILILWSLTFQIKEMSEILGLSENTVGKYRSNIRQKTKKADIYTLVEHVLG